MKNIIDIINKWKELQTADATLCPKCECSMMAPSSRRISRRADAVICSHCMLIEDFEIWLESYSDATLDLSSKEYNEICFQVWCLIGNILEEEKKRHSERIKFGIKMKKQQEVMKNEENN